MQYEKLVEDTTQDEFKDPRHIQSKDINPGSISVDPNLFTPDADAKRKKYIKWGIIGGIVLILVVLAIVLPLVLIKGGGGGDDNGRKPLPPGQMNPYSTVPGSSVRGGSGESASGQLLIGDLNGNADQKNLQ